MDILSPVILYTHEGSDATHYAKDEPALVLAVIDDNTLDVAVLPPGGPLRFSRVSRFDPEGVLDPPGQVYWREVGEDPPDFTAIYAYSTHPQWIAMTERQRREFYDTPAKDREELKKVHAQEREDLYNKLRAADGHTDEPTPELEPNLRRE